MADQKLLKFRDTTSGKIVEMPWGGSAPPTDEDINKFIQTQETKKPSAPEPVQEIEETTWDNLNRPRWEGPSRAARYLSNLIDPDDPQRGRSTGGIRGTTSAFLESVGDVVTSLTSPLNAGFALLTGGAGVARGAVARGVTKAIPVAKTLRGAEATASGAMGLKAGAEIYEDPTNPMGYVDAGLSALGARQSLKEIPKIKAPAPVKAAFEGVDNLELEKLAKKDPAARAELAKRAKSNVKTPAEIDSEFAQRGAARDIAAGTPPPPTPNGGIVDKPKIRPSAKGYEEVTLINPTPDNLRKAKDSGYTPIGANPDGSMQLQKVTEIGGPESVPELINADIVKRVSEPVAKAPEPVTPVQRITDALKRVVLLRDEADDMLSQDRARKLAASKAVGAKTSGREGFHQELAQLAGEAPKPQFESIVAHISEEDIKELFEMAKHSPNLDQTSFEPIRAREALEKLLGERGGQIPQANEIELLRRVYGSDFADTILRIPPLTLKSVLAKVVGSSKALRATMDLSFPLRQGLPYIGNTEFWKSFEPMIRSAFSSKYFNERQVKLKTRHNARLAQEAGLDLTDLHTNREEQFVDNFIERIPGFGKIVKGSNRAYVAFGNELRASLFDSMVKDGLRLGMRPGEMKKIANFINTTTGRGKLGNLEKVAGELNTALFSPRLLSSRIQMLTNPKLYLGSGKAARKQALRSLISVSGFVGGAAMLAHMAGADIVTDSNDSDFMKIKFGNARLDLAGGFQQPIRAMSQLWSGKYVSDGKTREMGDTYTAPTRWTTLTRFGQSKLSPVASFVVDLLHGKDFKNEPINAKDEIVNLMVPMITQDLYELYQEDPDLLWMGLPAVFGAGAQVYEKKVKSNW